MFFSFLIFYMPFISFVILFFLGNFIGKKGSIFISLFSIFLSVLSLLILFYNFLKKGFFIIFLNFGNWFSIGSLQVNWDFVFDSLSLFILIIILVISFLVHLFSSNYMFNDPNIIKFLSFLSLFTFFMVILVSANNFLVLFVGWEGVGLCSYLLICFWNTRIQCLKAANKALLVNKIGDFCLLIALAAIVFTFNSFDFYFIFSMAHQYSLKVIKIFYFEINLLSFISFFLMLAAMAKSAQLFFHTWLPDAMEGPTPVSALIHSATMVIAGIFLIIKCSFIIEFSKDILIFIVYVGIITSIVTSLIGFFQHDIKKIIAYSTCSQLGYMFFCCGLSGYYYSLFHLFNHAFFKSLLFLSSGFIIHYFLNEQDTRKMGSLSKIIPVTYVIIFIASLSLIGFPFLSGFFSKDYIAELAYLKLCNDDYFHLYILSLFSICLTTLYSLKLIFFSFFFKSNSFKKVVVKFHEFFSFPIFFTLVFLFFFSVFSGYYFGFFFLFENFIFFFKDSVFINVDNFLTKNFFIPFFLSVIPFFLVIITLCIYLYFFLFLEKDINFKLFSKLEEKEENFFSNCVKTIVFFNKKLFMDDIYNMLVLIIYKFGYSLFKNLDKGLLELLGPEGLFFFFFNLAFNFNKFYQSGYVYRYTFSILFNVILIFFIVFFIISF